MKIKILKITELNVFKKHKYYIKVVGNIKTKLKKIIRSIDFNDPNFKNNGAVFEEKTYDDLNVIFVFQPSYMCDLDRAFFDIDKKLIYIKLLFDQNYDSFELTNEMLKTLDRVLMHEFVHSKQIDMAEDEQYKEIHDDMNILKKEEHYVEDENEILSFHEVVKDLLAKDVRIFNSPNNYMELFIRRSFLTDAEIESYTFDNMMYNKRAISTNFKFKNPEIITNLNNSIMLKFYEDIVRKMYMEIVEGYIFEDDDDKMHKYIKKIMQDMLNEPKYLENLLFNNIIHFINGSFIVLNKEFKQFHETLSKPEYFISKIKRIISVFKRDFIRNYQNV